MSHIITNVEDFYKIYFNEPYKIPVKKDVPSVGMFNTPLYGDTKMFGVPVLLPVKLTEMIAGGIEIELSCCTIKVQGKRTIVRTPVAERVGTVKEEYNINDYAITIKGVLIGENRSFPDEQMWKLKELFESGNAVQIKNAITDLFLNRSKQIAIESVEFPEVVGKTLRHRPFVIQCESDMITDLIWNENV